MSRWTRAALGLLLIAVAVAACGNNVATTQRASSTTVAPAAGPVSTDPLSSGSGPNGSTTTAEPDTPVPDGVTSVVAHTVGSSIGVFDSPVQPEPTRRLASPRRSGGELIFLVREVEGDWLKVLVPVRPNGATGWIRRSDVTITTHPYRIEVSMSEHKITVWKGTDVVLSGPVGVGKGNSPTPGGFFYTVELYSSNTPAYGPFAYGLSGFSEVFYDFGGGDGQFGIHGTNEPSALGTDVSHGCIRMSNENITKLAGELPVGVPVEVKT